MPGLIGFSTAEISREASKTTIERMQTMLAHRPSFQVDPAFQGALCIGSRVHPGVFNPEEQPASTDGVKVWLDGEFTNRAALKAQAEIDAESYADDAQILAALYAQADDFGFLKEIDGIFSAAIYDEAAEKVHLVCDRYGLRPLYWTLHNGNIAWSSELKAFLELPGFEPSIDPLAVEDFFGLRYLIGDRTWFEGVSLVPAATVLTWSAAQKTVTNERYWWWDEVPALDERLSEDQLAEELGQRFRAAVEKRSLAGERTGLTLSGGLDSRAIIAAMPQHREPIEAITYGKKNCEDIRLARQVAKLKGANFHAIEINAGNWLQSRIEKVWETDGACSLIHMQFTAALEKIVSKELFDCLLHGAGGDGFVGGEHLFPPEETGDYILKRLNLRNFADSEDHKDSVYTRFKDYYSTLGGCPHILYIDNRIRSFLLKDVRVTATYGIETRLPFLDNDFQEMLYAVPNELKRNNVLYSKLLLKTFPEFFERIPRQGNGGEPISPPGAWRKLKKRGLKFTYRVHNKVKRTVRSAGLPFPDWDPFAKKGEFYDYDTWLTQDPARSFVEDILFNEGALYPNYIDGETAKEYWRKHVSGEQFFFDKIGQILTFEIWLQQVFNQGDRG